MTKQDDLLSHWFLGDVSSPMYKPNSMLWFRATPQQDEELASKFGGLVEAAKSGELDDWKLTMKGRLGLILLFDQIPRNVFRGTSRMFELDDRACSLAMETIFHEDFGTLSVIERGFFAIALMHSEDPKLVQQSVELMSVLRDLALGATKATLRGWLEGAKKHLEVLRTYKRYPHRNELLGRESTEAEIELLEGKKNPRWMSSVKKQTKASGDPVKAQKSTFDSSVATGKSRLKILLLHSFRQNSSIMKARCRSMKVALEPIADIIYANAPHSYNPAGEEREATLSAFGDLLETKHQRCWWNSSAENDEYTGLDFSIATLQALSHEQGPFDGIIGFSQGGALTGIVAAMHEQLQLDLKFVIIISAFISRAKQHQELLVPGAIRLPSLHIYGTKDLLVDNDRSIKLAECFVDPVILSHDGGHFVPGKWPLAPIQAFLGRFQKEDAGIGISAEELFESALAQPEEEGLRGKAKATSEHTLSHTHRNKHSGLKITFETIIPCGIGAWGATALKDQKWRERILGNYEVAEYMQVVREVVPYSEAEGGGQYGSSLVEDALVIARCARENREVLVRKRFHARRIRLSKGEDVARAQGSDDPLIQTFLHFLEVERETALALVKDLPHLTSYKDLTVLAVAGHLKACSEPGFAETYAALEVEVVEAIAEQLRKDGAAYEKIKASEAVSVGSATDVVWPSLCCVEAPRKHSHADKLIRLARKVAARLNPIEIPEETYDAGLSAEAIEARKEKKVEYAKRMCYHKYTDLLTSIGTIHNNAKAKQIQRAEMESILSMRGVNKVFDDERWRAAQSKPVSEFVTQPRPEPVEVAPIAELEPLFDFLKRPGTSIEDTKIFTRGAVMPDGRLDLCKQVVGPGGIGPLLEALADNEHVKKLLLGNNVVENQGAAAIADFINTKKSKLTTWYIAGNNFDENGIEPICESLAHDTQVNALWLKRNPLKPAGMANIARMMATNRTIVTLDVSFCGALDAGCIALFEALSESRNQTIRHLFLSGNGIGVAGAEVIGKHLPESPLTALYADCNRLGDEGVAHLCDGLDRNSTLQILALSSDRVGPEGARRLAESLKRNSSLLKLDLGFTHATTTLGEMGNAILDDGATHLGEMLKVNTTLVSLTLLHNSISQVGVNAISAALEQNSTLTALPLTQFGKVHNSVVREGIKRMLQRNASRYADRSFLHKVEFPDHNVEIHSVYRLAV